MLNQYPVASRHWLAHCSPAVLAAIVLCASSANIASAQQTGSATLVGSITDSTGARVPGAQVVVINVDMAFRSETKSNAEGEYYVPYLRPGAYRITVDAGGFKRFLRDGVVLRTAETPRVDIVLEVGATSEQITITAAAPLLATETATAGAIIGSSTILAIPVAQKRANKLLLYFPEASGSNGYHIMGQRQRSMGYTLDGVSGKVPGTGAALGVNDSIHSVLDAVQEAKVTSTGMAAEIGHSAGGALSLVFRSGTNELHGSFEDRVLDGHFIHRYYLQQAKTPNPVRLQFIDATASGPMVIPKLYNGRNKTFWLGAYAIHLEHQGETGLAYTVPSEAMLNGDFSFGGLGLPLYDPFTTRQDATGKWIRDPIPSNQIPLNRFDPAVKKFLSYNPFVKPNVPGTMSKTGPVNNLAAEGPKTIKRIRWDSKIDHQFTSNHKIFGRYSQAHHRAARAQKYPEFAWDLLDYNGSTIPVDLINIVFNDTLILGPARFNDARLGYYRRHYSLNALSYGQNWAQKLGIPNVSGETFPFFNIGYRMTGMGQEAQVGEDFTFQDNFSQIIGAHTFKMGYELMRTRYNAVLQVLPGGTYNFSGTEFPYVANTGNTFASFLLGTVGSATFSQNFGSWLPRWWQHAFYFQDDWKASRSLSISMGLRWNYESPLSTKYGQQSQFDPTITDPLTGRLGAVTHPKGQLARKDLNNFQPRLGLAWTFRPKWVFRSSFAIMNPDLGVNDVGQNFEEYQATTNIQSPTGDPRHAFVLSQGPGTITYPVSSNGTIPYVGTNYSARSVSWYDPNMRIPYVMNWSAGFQRQLSSNWLVEMTYQGTAGVRLLNSWNINAIPLNISTDPAVLNQIYRAQQNYKPYPQFGSVNLYSNFGHNTHHAGTLRVEKRYSAGLTLTAFYTYAKTLDESDADGGASGVSYYNRALEKGRAGYDIRHRYTHILTWEFPLGKGRRFLNRGGIVNGVLGGWELAWVQTFENGLPSSITFSGSPNNYLSQGVYRPNTLVKIEDAVVHDWNIGPNRFPLSDNRAQNPYLRFSAFSYPAAFTVGTLGRNVYEGPGVNWTQMSISKSWRIRERARIVARIDMMNLPLKQPSYNVPNSTFNANSPYTFGTFSGTRGDTSNMGTGQPNYELDIRVEF